MTTVAGTGTYDANGGTPSGAWLGSNVNKLIRRISIKDNANTDILQIQGTDIHHVVYLLSITDPNEFLFDRGISVVPSIDTGTVTAQINRTVFPQSIAFKDLPASIEIEIGTLDDYYNVAGTGTATLDAVNVTVRYASPTPNAFTMRCKAFNTIAFSSNQDIAHLLPEQITYIAIAYLPSNPNAGSAPSDMVNTRVDRLSFRRGSNEEIESQLRDLLDDFVDQVYTGNRTTGLTVIPSDAWVKTDATLFKFEVNAQITPRVYYLFK